MVVVVSWGVGGTVLPWGSACISMYSVLHCHGVIMYHHDHGVILVHDHAITYGTEGLRLGLGSWGATVCLLAE